VKEMEEDSEDTGRLLITTFATVRVKSQRFARIRVLVFG
jgi:hypothetical protein